MINMDLAANIRRFRKAAGLSMEAAARKLGVSWSTWAKWESGEVDIPSSRLTGIAEVLGVTAAALLEPAEQPA